MLPAATTLAASSDRNKAEANLKAVQDRIERVRQQVQHDAVEKDRLNRDLNAAEKSVAQARGDLTKVQQQRAQRNAARQQLEKDKAEREQQRARTQQNLTDQLRAAYFMGRDEPLKLLLNQKDPAQFGRNLTYYGYFGRLRASQISEINQNIAKIDELKAAIDEEDAKLAQLEDQNHDRINQLDAARRQRGRVLASLEKQSSDRNATLKRLQQQQNQLEKLLKELSRAIEAAPYDPNDAFANLRGKLSWPVSGRIETSFGDTIAGGLRSNGIVIAADRGNKVTAVQEGRVVYADWLPGRGLLIIIDHGNGYMSLYGHNEQLFKQAGATVKAGDAIAAAGDSGGRSQSGLYFEIRRGGKPVDPKPWFRTAAPPAG
ncbi:MAG: peptidoglycan DD-metalloendopeptidase family protein [Pseudomonadota bacterium]